VVVVQEGPESRAANDRAGCSVVVREPGPGLDELTIDALVEAFPQIVLHELRDHMAQMTLPEEDEVIQALVLIVFTNGSACGLQLGLFAGVFTLATPLVRRIATNASVNNGSRS